MNKKRTLAIRCGILLILNSMFFALELPRTGAQVSPEEYVQSTSPLRDGRTVTRTIFADKARASQVVISSQPRIANLPNLDPNMGFPRTGNQGTGLPGKAANSAPALGAPPNQIGQPPFELPPPLPNSGEPGESGDPDDLVYAYPEEPADSKRYGRFVPNSGIRPLIRLRTLPANTYLGQGILGQPTAYVPGEPIRNMIRYIMP